MRILYFKINILKKKTKRNKIKKMQAIVDDVILITHQYISRKTEERNQHLSVNSFQNTTMTRILKRLPFLMEDGIEEILFWILICSKISLDISQT